MVLGCLDYEGIRNDKFQWLAIAQFLGEIRSKIIPNYKKQSGWISMVSGDPAEEAAIQKAIEENKRHAITDSFQSELQQANDRLSPLFQHDSFFQRGGCPFIQPGQPVDTNFIHQISTAAHLTDAEKQSLGH